MLPRAELLNHIPAFVDELIRALHPDAMSLPPMSANAEEHGEQRLVLGFDVAEVIREYGMLHEYEVSSRNTRARRSWSSAHASTK